MSRQQLNPIAMILLTVLIVAVKTFYFPNLAEEHRIFYLGMVAIAVLVSGFEIVKYIYAHRCTSKRREMMPPAADRARRASERATNLRDAYRLIYPPESRPILEVNRTQFDHPINHKLVILDLSEAGLGFQHDGLLPLTDTVLGRIRFSDGEYLEVAGDVVHHQHDRVGLALHCYIPHERFMQEQRTLITSQKPNRLNLEVMKRSMGSGRPLVNGRTLHPELASGCPCQRSRD
jgi:hypothetical protein